MPEQIPQNLFYGLLTQLQPGILLADRYEVLPLIGTGASLLEKAVKLETASDTGKHDAAERRAQLGLIVLQQNRFSEAANYLKSAISILEDLHSYQGLAEGYVKYAHVLRLLGREQEAAVALVRAKQIADVQRDSKSPPR